METKKILIVEDEQIIGDLVADSLGEGFHIIQAENFAEASDIYRSAEPDMMIIDNHIPGGRIGREIIEQLKNNKFSRPVDIIILSDDPGIESVFFNHHSGTGAILKKPFSNMNLLGTVRNLLDVQLPVCSNKEIAELSMNESDESDKSEAAVSIEEIDPEYIAEDETEVQHLLSEISRPGGEKRKSLKSQFENIKNSIILYFIKKLHPSRLRAAFARMRKTHTQKQLKKQIENSAQSKLRAKVPWMTQKEQRKTADKSGERDVIHNLKASLSQGEGFGTMIALVEYILSSRDTETGKYEIDDSMLTMLHENIRFGRNIIEGLGTIVDLYSHGLELSNVTSHDYLNNISNIIKNIEECARERSLILRFHHDDINSSLQVNRPALDLAVEELLVNALKYSKPNGQIDIYTQQIDDHFCLSVKNEIPDNNVGIPPDMEQIVLEPFCRLHPPVLGLPVEKFSLGLGLTVVNHIVQKHEGMFTIGNIMDRSRSENRRCVLAQVFLPIATD